MSKNRPKLYGLIATENPTGHFSRMGKVAVWSQNVAAGTKRPPLVGKLEIKGQQYRIALWENREE